MLKSITQLCALIKRAQTIEQKYALFYVFYYMEVVINKTIVVPYDYQRYADLTGLNDLIFDFLEELNSRRRPHLDFMTYDDVIAFTFGSAIDRNREYQVEHTHYEAVERMKWLKRDEYHDKPISELFNSYARLAINPPKLIDGLIVFKAPCPYGDPYQVVLPTDVRKRLRELLRVPQLERNWNKMVAHVEAEVQQRLYEDTVQRTTPLTKQDEVEIDQMFKDLGIDLDTLFQNTDTWGNKVKEYPEEGSLFHQVYAALEKGEYVDEGLIQAFTEYYPTLFENSLYNRES